MSADTLADLHSIFNTESLAVIGISTDEQNPRGNFLGALRDFGFKGKLYAVNPNGREIPGFSVYANVRDIPDRVDFALIMVPAAKVPAIVEDCLMKGLKGVEIFSSGFGETGEEEGRRLETELKEIAQRGIRIIGPNGFGVYNASNQLTFLAGLDFPKESGTVAFVSQSGGFSVEFGSWAKSLDIRLSKVISFGNALDLNEADYMEYLAQDDKTRIIASYLEGTRDGKRLLDIVRRASRTKPVIIWKGGLTELGARAARSHTGSLGGEKSIWEAFFRQSGAIRAGSLDDIKDLIIAFVHLAQDTGRRIGLLGGGGGISVAAADVCNRAGLELPPFGDGIRQELSRYIPAAGTSVRNPVDFGGPMIPLPAYEKTLEIMAGNPDVDTIIVVLVSQLIFGLMRRNRRLTDSAIDDLARIHLKIREKFGKPVVIVLTEGAPGANATGIEEDRRKLQSYYLANGIPVFQSLDRAANAVSKFIQYHSTILNLSSPRTS